MKNLQCANVQTYYEALLISNLMCKFTSGMHVHYVCALLKCILNTREEKRFGSEPVARGEAKPLAYSNKAGSSPSASVLG